MGRETPSGLLGFRDSLPKSGRDREIRGGRGRWLDICWIYVGYMLVYGGHIGKRAPPSGNLILNLAISRSARALLKGSGDQIQNRRVNSCFGRKVLKFSLVDQNRLSRPHLSATAPPTLLDENPFCAGKQSGYEPGFSRKHETLS